MEEENRFDVYYYPAYHEVITKLKKLKTTTISELLKEEIVTGYGFSSTHFLDVGEAELIRIRNIGTDGIKEENLKYIPTWLYDEHRDVEIKKGDILIGMDGDDFRALVINKERKAVANQRIAVLRVKSEISAELIAEYINSHLGDIQLERKKTKTTAGHITKNDISNIVIPEVTDKLQKNILKIIAEIKSAIEDRSLAKDRIDSARNTIQETFLKE